jgi:hypothetical protein
MLLMRDRRERRKWTRADVGVLAVDVFFWLLIAWMFWRAWPGNEGRD